MLLSFSKQKHSDPHALCWLGTVQHHGQRQEGRGGWIVCAGGATKSSRTPVLFSAYFPHPPNYFHNNLSRKTRSYKTGKLWGLAYRPTSQSAQGSAIVSEKNTGPPLSLKSGALRTRPVSTSQFPGRQAGRRQTFKAGKSRFFADRVISTSLASSHFLPPSCLLLPPPFSSYLVIATFHGSLCFISPFPKVISPKV